MVVFENVKKDDLLKLKGFSKEEAKTIFEELRLKKDNVTLILYNSGKLLLQGKADDVEKAVRELKKIGIQKLKGSGSFRKESGWIIGTDESLKGDTFGGLVVAGVKANDAVRKKLLELGVADSKMLSDKEILILVDKIKTIAPCEIKSLLPEEFNKSHDVTHLLNKMHKECADDLSPGKHVVDKFPGCAVGDVAVEQAESKYIEVAAASVLARAIALKQLDYLSVQAGFVLPKGSTHVKPALEEMKKKGLDFKKFVKVDFSNVKEFL